MISYDTQTNIIHLQTKGISYVIEILKNKYPMQLYYGKRVEKYTKYEENRPLLYKDGWTGADIDEYGTPLDSAQLAWEFPCFGRPDLRIPAFCAEYENGSGITEFIYESQKIYKGKKSLDGLPATYAESEDEVDSIDITLADKYTGLKAVLSYSVFEEYDAITKSVRIINDGRENVNIKSVMSSTVHMFDSEFELLHLSGTWAREAHIKKEPIMQGVMQIDSRFGASGHEHRPFIVLARPAATETTGEVYGFSLVYSGNHIEQTERNYFDIVRVCIGINPFGFNWQLELGESFQAPEAVLTYSDEGFGKMSDTYHRLYRERLCREKYKNAERPVLANSWEAYYTKVDEEKLLSLANKAKELDIEMIVLDDGWFGRGSSGISLGDWYADKEKFPNGINSVAEKINQMGLKFGIWFEPEMMSVKSELFKKHPEWCIHAPDRLQSPINNRYVMDLSRKDVCEFIYETISNILKDGNVAYIKWDYNRNMTDMGSEYLPQERQQELSHRYMLGLYSVLDRLNKDFPDVLFEGCASGGGRLDPGMMYYFSQYWTSDCTDAVERMYIQHGMSMFVPSSFMSSHVSAVPNHQTGRKTSLHTRGVCAMAGTFGYELDPAKMTDEERREIREQIVEYKKYAQLVQNGLYYRLSNPFAEEIGAWEFASEDGKEVLVNVVMLEIHGNMTVNYVKMKGLCVGQFYKDSNTGKIYPAEALMEVGIPMPLEFGEYKAYQIYLEMVE